MSGDSVSNAILRVLERRNPTLFVGAGIGARVDYPTWPAYMEELAKACERWNDDDSARLIRGRVERGCYPEAATVYKSCDVIPTGERWKGLAQPFTGELTDGKKDRLVPLVALPFSAVVTTNYDHSLHQACVRRGRWFLPVELNDGTVRGTTFQRDFFVARIHGRAEVPESMVLSVEDYNTLRGNAAYTDFVLDILRSRSCLFVGFSFLDPAVSEVMDLYGDRAGPVFEPLHTAIIPESSEELAAKLRTLNIEVVTYGNGHDHAALWRGVRVAWESQKSRGRERPALSAPTAGLQRFMAFAYAQVQLRNGEGRGAAEVVEEGIVIGLLRERSPTNGGVRGLAESLRPVLRLSGEEATRIVARCIERLISRGQIRWEGTELELCDSIESPLEQDLERLAVGASDRALVQHGVRLKPSEVSTCKTILETCLLSRAWDLAAHYAGAASGFGQDIRGVVRDLIKREALQGSLRKGISKALEWAMCDLLHDPEPSQATLLARLGRAAFGLQLILSTPRQVLFQQFALPERLYLDANVVMPAITKGHPLRGTYGSALKRLARAADNAGGDVKVVVESQFLNEVVNHRSRAIEAVRRLGLENTKEMQRYTSLQGASYTNVFVGAFASIVGQSEDTSFSDFLDDAAPYESAEELSAYLGTLGIQTGETDASFDELFGHLLDAYERTEWDTVRHKEKILIRDEAQQLMRLAQDEENGIRSVFVTADERLRRLLHRAPNLRRFGGMTMSGLGLVALVDVMVGLEADPRSLVRLVWATPQTDEQATLLEYFTRVGLMSYEEGAAVEMQEAARKVAGEMAKETRKRKIRLLDPHNLDDVEAAKEVLERYEENFFRYWREAIERRGRQANER